MLRRARPAPACASEGPTSSLPGRRSARCRVLLVCIGDPGGLIIAGMNNHAITKSQRLSRLERQAPIGGFVVQEIVQSENVGGEQAVASGMPVRGVPGISGII